MENKYLEKVAGYLDNLTGHAVRENESMMRHLADAAASGKSYADYAGEHPKLEKAMWKARVGTGAAAVGAVGLGAFALHKYKQNKEREIMDAYNDILHKEAGVMKSIGNKIFRGVRGTTNRVGRTIKNSANGFAEMSNTALGGKIGDFGEAIRLPKKVQKEFESSNAKGQMKILIRHAGGTGQKIADPRARAQHKISLLKAKTALRELHKQKGDAKMGIAGLAAIPAAAYGVGHYVGKQKSENQYADTNIYY